MQDLDRAARLDVDSGTGLPGVSSAIRAIRSAMDHGVTAPILVSTATGSALAPSDVPSILASRLDYSMTVGSRQVDVSIASSWNMLNLAPGISMDDVLLRLDEFAVRGTNRET